MASLSAQPSATSRPQATRQLLTDLSLLVPRAYPEFIEKYPNIAKDNYLVGMESVGRIKFTANRDFYHWESLGKTLPAFRVNGSGSPVTGSAGADVTVTLTAGSHYNGGGDSPVAAGYEFTDNTTNRTYLVISVNKGTPSAHTAVLRPTKAAGATSIADGEQLNYKGRPHTEEGSTKKQGLFSREEKITGQATTIRTDQEFTDLNLFEKTDIPDSPAGYSYYRIRQTDKETERFMGVQELQLMLGDSTDNLGATNQNSSATGLVQQVFARGQAVNQTGVDANLFRAYKRRIEAEGYSNEYHGLLDTELEIGIQDYLKGNYPAGQVVYASFNGQQSVALSQNFESYSIYGVTYHFKSYKYFNAARTWGADLQTGFFNSFGLWIPQGTVKDPKSGDNVDRFAIRYQAQKEGDPIIMVGQDGMFAEPSIGTDARLTISHLTYKGIETYGLTGYMTSKIS